MNRNSEKDPAGSNENKYETETNVSFPFKINLVSIEMKHYYWSSGAALLTPVLDVEPFSSSL